MRLRYLFSVPVLLLTACASGHNGHNVDPFSAFDRAVGMLEILGNASERPQQSATPTEAAIGSNYVHRGRGNSIPDFPTHTPTLPLPASGNPQPASLPYPYTPAGIAAITALPKPPAQGGGYTGSPNGPNIHTHGSGASNTVGEISVAPRVPGFR